MDLERDFANLSLKFIFVCESSVELNALLNDLNSLDFKSQQIANANEILQFLESITKIPSTSDINIKIKACHLIKQLITKQKVNLPDVISNKIINWILQCNRSDSQDVFACEALEVLALLFKKNSGAALKHVDIMLSSDGILLNLLQQSPGSSNKILSHDYTLQEIYKSSLACIESILLHLEQDLNFEIAPEYLETTGKMLIKFIYNFKQNEIQDNDFMTIATLTINSLKFIGHSSPEFTNGHVGELIGIAKAFMMYGLPEINYHSPVKVMSSQQAILEQLSEPMAKNSPSASKKKITKSKNKRNENSKGPARQQNEENPYKQFAAFRTSDSDFSDNEHSREMVNRNKQVKLRLAALTLLFVVSNEVEKRIIFGFWHCLLYTDDTVTITLGNSLLKDSSPRCRIVALQSIIQLLKISKPFLTQAENKDKSKATFTPFSVTLGNMIVFTYEILTQALIKEGDFTVLTQILKCISIFITVTPFHRLQDGIVSRFIKFVRILLRHKDPTIKVAALIVIKNLISLPEMTTEILEIVEIPKSKIEFNWRKIDESLRSAHPKDEDELIDMEFEVDEDEEIEEQNVEESMSQLNVVAAKMPWLLQTILENLGVHKGVLKLPSIALSVRIESLQVLSAMSSHYLLLKDHLLPISMALSRSLHDSTFDEKFHASRALEFIGSSINNFLSQDSKTQHDMDISLAFWLRILPNVFENIQDINQSPTFRASLADALSNIGVHNYEKLDFMKQTQLKSILTGCCYDEDVNVRSSAVRALSLYVLFPSLREDLCFIENTIESVLRIIKDQNLLSRTKSSFGLANIVDSLLIIKDTVAINENLLRQIVESCLHAAGDNDRVKVNVFRSLGNSILLLTKVQLDTAVWQNIFEKSIDVLTQQLTSSSGAKVKWNICHALSSIMKNLSIFDDKLRRKWQSKVFKQLNAAIENSPNFKVRTNACIALMTPKERGHYGEFFIDIWNCLLIALEQSNNLTDFNEYKHRDALQDQLCSAISHFLALSTIDDVCQMKKYLFPLIDITKQNWNRVINRVPPEHQSELLKGFKVLNLLKENCKNSEQKNSVELLVSCFKPVDEYF